jgi:iron complex outermembrane receptor protein
MSNRFVRALLLGHAALLPLLDQQAIAQEQEKLDLPTINVSAPRQIRKRAPRPARPAPAPAAPSTPIVETPLLGATPIASDQFGTVTVVPREEIQRNPGTTLGDVLFSKPGITGSSFAPGGSSRPIVRGLDGNRVGIVNNGIGSGGASDLGEDHFVPIDPMTTNRIEVIRGPATLRYGSQAIGGVVSATDNRIPEAIPCLPAAAGFANFETRGALSSVDSGIDGAQIIDAGGGNFAFHADAFGRRTQDYRIPSYPYLTAPDLADAPRTTQPGAFNGRQPNSKAQSDGGSIGGSYVFPGGYMGLAVVQNDALYHIPGIDGEDHNTRIDAQQTKLLGKGEFRAPVSAIDAVRFWAGVTDYKHRELGLADDTNLASDGTRQIFTNKEQEGRVEVQFAPVNLKFAALSSTMGVQSAHQELTAPSPDNAGLFDPNSNWRVASYIFNEFKFSEATKAQIAGRIEHIELSGTGRIFDNPLAGSFTSLPAAPKYTPKSISVGLIQNLPWYGLVGSATAQYVERAPKPAELFSGGGHDATATFDKGNPDLGIESATSFEVGLRRPVGPFRFEAMAYTTHFDGFIFRRLTGNTCDGDTGVCGPGPGELREAIYSQANANFRGGEFQFQWDMHRAWDGFFGIEGQYDIVRATFSDGTNVPRIPPQRLGGGVYFRSADWLARVNLLHAFAQNDIATIGETPTAGYNLLKAEISRTTVFKNDPSGIKQVTVGLVGNNLLNADIRNHVSYTKDEVLMPGLGVRLFASVKY